VLYTSLAPIGADDGHTLRAVKIIEIYQYRADAKECPSAERIPGQAGGRAVPAFVLRDVTVSSRAVRLPRNRPCIGVICSLWRSHCLSQRRPRLIHKRP
jgi:hypothetical protein